MLLAKYRESEQRQLVEFERNRIDKLEEDVSSFYNAYIDMSCLNADVEKKNQQVRKELEDVHSGQTLLIEKLIQCCKEVRFPYFRCCCMRLTKSVVCHSPTLNEHNASSRRSAKSWKNAERNWWMALREGSIRSVHCQLALGSA